MTTTDSAKVTPTAGGPVAVHTAERVGTRAPAAVRAERRAWLILWLAFATFCSLMFAVVKFTADYVTTAQVDQGAHVTASRGLVFTTAPGSPDKTLLGTRSELGVGTMVTLDRASVTSAELQFFDDSRMQALGGASVELTRMEVGRFINQHSLVLTQVSGPIRYTTGGAPMDVIVPNGLVQLAPRGDYTIWLDGDTTRVLVYGAEARVSASGATVTVPDGRLAEIDAARQVHPPVDRSVPLLLNSDFGLHDQNWQAFDKPNSALDVNGARFWLTPPADVPGAALRVVRESRKSEHGETGLIQTLNRDVSGFRHLWLSALVRIDYADLSGGGTLGTEYPMMLGLKYEGPQAGSQPGWAVGFYYSNEDNRVVPEWLGQLWPQGEWKSYSVDLMNTETSSVPYRLLEFTVLGQGHSYDARIANITLVGD